MYDHYQAEQLPMTNNKQPETPVSMRTDNLVAGSQDIKKDHKIQLENKLDLRRSSLTLPKDSSKKTIKVSNLG